MRSRAATYKKSGGGKNFAIESHPNADKLVVCFVDVGAQEPIQIVTGATNLQVGDRIPVALDGLYPARRRQNQKGQAPGGGEQRYALLSGRAGLDHP